MPKGTTFRSWPPLRKPRAPRRRAVLCSIRCSSALHAARRAVFLPGTPTGWRATPSTAARILHLLDTGELLDLRFPTYTFENTPQGKFMLGIMFSQSKYYVDALSENIRRGNRARRESGWGTSIVPF